jgi:hypothetical protein
MTPTNPQEWFIQLLTQALLHLQLQLVDALFGLIGRASFFFHTDRALTVDHPAVAAAHAAMLGLAGGLLGLLWLAGALQVGARGLGLGDLTPQRLVGRLLVAAAAAVTSRWWMGWAIDLNNALCALVGGERLGRAVAGPAAIARLLGLTPAQEQAFVRGGDAAGDAISAALRLAYFGATGLGASALAGLLLLVLALLVFLLAVQFWLRHAVLLVLIASMPLLLVLWAHPATGGWAAQWLRWFFPAVFLQAAQVAVLALAHQWLRQAYGEFGATPAALLTPLLMTIAVLLLTLRVAGWLELGAHGPFDAAGAVAGAGRVGLALARRGRR